MKVVSFFSGLGGLDKGFVDTGYDIIWANDFDKYAVQTYKANFGEHIVLGDINSNWAVKTKSPGSTSPET